MGEVKAELYLSRQSQGRTRSEWAELGWSMGQSEVESGFSFSLCVQTADYTKSYKYTFALLGLFAHMEKLPSCSCAMIKSLVAGQNPCRVQLLVSDYK